MSRLEEFGRRVIRRMEQEAEWSADTLDEINAIGAELGLCGVDSNGMFTANLPPVDKFCIVGFPSDNKAPVLDTARTLKKARKKAKAYPNSSIAPWDGVAAFIWGDILQRQRLV